jgi:hypothetical protein
MAELVELVSGFEEDQAGAGLLRVLGGRQRSWKWVFVCLRRQSEVGREGRRGGGAVKGEPASFVLDLVG